MVAIANVRLRKKTFCSDRDREKRPASYYLISMRIRPFGAPLPSTCEGITVTGLGGYGEYRNYENGNSILFE